LVEQQLQAGADFSAVAGGANIIGGTALIRLSAEER